MRTALRRRRLHPIVAIERDASVLWAPRVANGALAFDAVARIPLQGEPADLARDGHAAIAALPRANGGTTTETRVVIALPASQVLRKSVVLPAAVEENLHQTLAYDLDRHTPFKADEVYFDAIVVGRDAARKEIRVDLAAALKSFVDQVRRRVESWGARVVAVTPESPSGAAALAATTLNLLPPDERPDTSRMAPVADVGSARRSSRSLPWSSLRCRSGRSACTRSLLRGSPTRRKCRPTRRARCATSSSASPATTTSRCSASTRSPLRCRSSRT